METSMNEELVAGIVRKVLEGTESQAHIRKAVVSGNDSDSSKAFRICPQMTLKLAVALIERVERRAEELGMRVVTAVSDAAGRPIAVHCMDGAYIGSFDVALNKTYTAIAFQMATAKLGELAVPGQPLYGIQHTNEGKIVIFGGGEPLTAGDLGNVIKTKVPNDAQDTEDWIFGAVGVSGGTAEQDTALAAYAKAIVKEVVSCL